MYYPYFRGKQFELMVIRENAILFHQSGFVPVLEPVKANLTGTGRAIESLIGNKAQVVVVVNPQYGDYSRRNSGLLEYLDELSDPDRLVSCGVLLGPDMAADKLESLLTRFSGRRVALVHSGFAHAQSIVEMTDKFSNIEDHLFVEELCSKPYRRNFSAKKGILIRDGFERRTNRDHPDIEFFSDLHLTFTEEGMQGFGDYLIVGNEFNETGGPAYTVAIHITYIDPELEQVMQVHHFKSDSNTSPVDPAGKFLEALTKLIDFADKNEGKIFESRAIQEFRSLYERRHFPGLGYIKKLSMQHHLETLANFFSR